MAGYHIERLGNEPVILQVISKEWQFSADMSASIDAAMGLLDEADQPMYFITDMTDAPGFNLQDLIAASGQITRSGNPILHHPRLREYLVVTQNSAMRLATKGLNSPAFGRVPARAFDMLDEALEYARSQTS